MNNKNVVKIFVTALVILGAGATVVGASAELPTEDISTQSDVSQVQEAVSVEVVEPVKVDRTVEQNSKPEYSSDTSKTTASTEEKSATSYEGEMEYISSIFAVPVEAEYEEKVEEIKPDYQVQNLQASTISVSSIKVTWDYIEGLDYQIDIQTNAIFKNNITYVRKAENVYYITGLRENSEYTVTITPVSNVVTYDNVTSEPIITPVVHNEFSATTVGKTEKVEIIQLYQYEYGRTNCFAGEKASGLTLMPSSGAIAGSICDPVTDTGIRRNEYGDYCCAMGLWYGQCGDRFLVELENGIQFTVEICDSKGMGDDADGDGYEDGRFHWFGGFGNGKCVVEFIFDDGNLPPSVAYSGSWGYEEWNGLDLTSNIVGIKKIHFGEKITY